MNKEKFIKEYRETISYPTPENIGKIQRKYFRVYPSGNMDLLEEYFHFLMEEEDYDYLIEQLSIIEKADYRGAGKLKIIDQVCEETLRDPNFIDFYQNYLKSVGWQSMDLESEKFSMNEILADAISLFRRLKGNKNL